MTAPGVEDTGPLIDLSIDTGDAATDTEVAQLLETLRFDELIEDTLQAIQIQEQVMLTLVVTGDTEIQALNQQYRQQDKPTDVLSFPLLDEPLVKAPPELLWQLPAESDDTKQGEALPAFVTPDGLPTNLGDIVISWPTTQRQATTAGHAVAYELLFLLCHGVLHLAGYDDQTEAGYAEMVRLQTEMLRIHSQGKL